MSKTIKEERLRWVLPIVTKEIKLVSGIAGTAFCASCLAPLFAFFGIGFGGVVFVLNYRWYFVVGVILLMLITIYLTARKINKVCVSC